MGTDDGRRVDAGVKFGVALGALNPHFHLDATLTADACGYESVWLPEHLVFTRSMTRSPHPGENVPPVPPTAPIYDAFAYLAFLAAKTEHVRLGTHVFNIGLRHPFTTARGVQTVDLLSNGRFEFGIGASWLEEEWDATQLQFATRGRRVDEAVAVCKRLWTEETISHHGEFFSFDDVVFEPKPVQRPWPPILVGGESGAALRRAAALGDGWIGMGHTVESATAQIERLRRALDDHERDPSGFEIVLGGPVAAPDDVARWEAIGVTRMIVSPWRRSPDAVEALNRFAEAIF
jgi:probable F420-dependent oxidoreductase